MTEKIKNNRRPDNKQTSKTTGKNIQKNSAHTALINFCISIKNHEYFKHIIQTRFRKSQTNRILKTQNKLQTRVFATIVWIISKINSSIY